MDFKFVNWYTQAIGSVLGIIACIYAYLNGFMFVYGNIENYFDFLGFSGVVSSYTLVPLCILTLLLAIIKSYNPDVKFLNISIKNINIFFIVLTVIIGFMGAKIYFAVPALLILFNLVSYKLEIKINENRAVTDVIEEKDMNSNKIRLTSEATIAITKKEMTIDLLNKNANLQFITDITGFSEEDVENIKKESNH
ncbi:MAG: hypothetical protein RSD47_02925 [Romboutsia sp.]